MRDEVRILDLANLHKWLDENRNSLCIKYLVIVVMR